MQAAGTMKRRNCALFLLILQSALLALSASWHSPLGDEVGHLSSGIAHWRTGAFDLYRVNPPLCRLIASAPAVLARADFDWSAYRSGSKVRPEWSLGSAFIEANPSFWFGYFVTGRLALIPLILLGGYVCCAWATDLYGANAGLVALCCWVFSPEILTWGSTILPDASAAALGVLAGYCFWRWLRAPSWSRASLAGLALGLAELTKSTWVVLFLLWPALWLTRLCSDKIAGSGWRSSGAQLAAILFAAIYVLNIGYAFEGSLQRLGDFTFVSRALAGEDAVKDRSEGNRFVGTWLGELPVPIPRNYLSGMDLAKLEFEEGKPSYWMGTWSDRGWWWYYSACAVLRIPLGTWALALLAVGATGWDMRRARIDRGRVVGQLYSAGWHDELVLLSPAVAVFLLVSSQTGYSHTFRYVLPCLPFVFIWISKLARSVGMMHSGMALAAMLALSWSVVSSLMVYPHSWSYFNELAGGPRNGHLYLLDINGGQDLWYLKQWYDSHPDARPLSVEASSVIDAAHFGIEAVSVLGGPADVQDREWEHMRQPGSSPGWHAISVYHLHDRDGKYDWFRHFEPAYRIGYSILVYHITLQDAGHVRRQMGLGVPQKASN
jgi:Dolichyl-phosphate-mannose-protein mannosyltransferase